MNVGLIARADDGGLATLTREFARHVRPTRTVIVDLRAFGRGPCRPERYDDDLHAQVAPHPIPDGAFDWLCDGTDVVYTAEVGYHPDWVAHCHARGVRTALHAMPELWVGDGADRVFIPTGWERHRIPEARLLPVPVATDRLPWSLRTDARRFLHIPAPAMLDRNGSDLVAQALMHITHDITLVVRGGRHEWPERIGRARVQRVPASAEYWEYPDADVLLLPRRYGGLCLPMQEAAALGMPTIALDREPNRGFHHRNLLAHATKPESVRMKGGQFAVWSTDPRALATVIDRAVENPDLVALASEDCHRWANGMSWELRTADYRSALRDVVSGRLGW